MFFEAVPSYTIHFPDAPDEKTELSRAMDYLTDPDDPAKSAGLFETPNQWPIPEDYDLWPTHKRAEFVFYWLPDGVNSWDGCKLGELESGSIERYLEHPELDDET